MIEKMIKTAVLALDSKKAHNIKIIKIDALTTVADYFIICNGTSTTQVKALADECEYQMSREGFEAAHREGRESGNWILLDYKDIIVHVFAQETRNFYNLEHFWKDGTEIDTKEFLEETK